jgi:hypothetical protein
MPNPAILTRAYKALSWAAVAGLALILVLVLRKSPPPDVPYDPTATTRVQQKFAAADQAKATGQPAQVQLDSTELNSYLSQILQTHKRLWVERRAVRRAAHNPEIPLRAWATAQRSSRCSQQ